MHTESIQKPAKRFFIKTFGCQMNYHDSDRMASHLTDLGFEASEESDKVDLVLLNSCSIRDKAQNKGVSTLGTWRKIKKENPKLRIGFTGCVAQHDGAQVLRSFPFLDFVLGTDQIDTLPEVLYRLDQGEEQLLLTDFDQSQDYSIETKIAPGKASAFVNIMKGCDNFCTYCIVPFTRGREKSRTIEEIVSDIEKLLRQGIVEITLLGQNVNSFGKNLGGKAKNQYFARLLREIEAMADRLDKHGITSPMGAKGKPRGLRLLRYTTSHPKDFDQDVIDAHGDLQRLVPHLHLPVQSGSPDVLRSMKRYLPIETYLQQVANLRDRVPGIALTSDIIVGFPGETEAEFTKTMDLINKVRFDGIYAYTYSERPGTKAAELEDDVPKAEKKRRLQVLMDRQSEIQLEINRTHVGQRFTVLVEGPSKSNPSFATARLPQWKTVNFPVTGGPIRMHQLRGTFVEIEITEASAFALKGKLCQ